MSARPGCQGRSLETIEGFLRALPFPASLAFLQEVWYFNTRLYVVPFMLFCWNLHPACKFLWAQIILSTRYTLSFSVLLNNEYIFSVIHNRIRKGENKSQTTEPNKQHLQVDISPGILLKISISNKFPGDADAAGPGTTLRKARASGF